MTNKKTIPEPGKGGRRPLFPFNTLLVGEGEFIKDAEDSLRSAVSAYAKRHKIKLVCRATHDESGERIGITVYRKK